MLPGITLRNREMSTLEQMRMRVTDRPMPRPLNKVVVMAMVEHMPKSCASTGFLVSRPSFSCFLKFIAGSLLPVPPRMPGRRSRLG